MEIVKRGEIVKPTQEFTCRYCGTVFRVELGEYCSCSQIEYFQSGSSYQCNCPVCKQLVYK